MKINKLQVLKYPDFSLKSPTHFMALKDAKSERNHDLLKDILKRFSGSLPMPAFHEALLASMDPKSRKMARELVPIFDEYHALVKERQVTADKLRRLELRLGHQEAREHFRMLVELENGLRLQQFRFSESFRKIKEQTRRLRISMFVDPVLHMEVRREQTSDQILHSEDLRGEREIQVNSERLMKYLTFTKALNNRYEFEIKYASEPSLIQHTLKKIEDFRLNNFPYLDPTVVLAAYVLGNSLALNPILQQLAQADAVREYNRERRKEDRGLNDYDFAVKAIGQGLKTKV